MSQPLHLIERFPGPAGESPNRLVAGDNLRALPGLLAEFAGRVDLVYLDPPFGTGDAFRVRSPRAGPSGASGRMNAADARRTQSRGPRRADRLRGPGAGRPGRLHRDAGTAARADPRPAHAHGVALPPPRRAQRPRGQAALRRDLRGVQLSQPPDLDLFRPRARPATLQRQARRSPLLHPRPALDVPPRADPRTAPGELPPGAVPPPGRGRDTRT